MGEGAGKDLGLNGLSLTSTGILLRGSKGILRSPDGGVQGLGEETGLVTGCGTKGGGVGADGVAIP